MLTGRAEGFVPGPTPAPFPATEGGVPAVTFSREGRDFGPWQTAFLAYAAVNRLPVGADGFEVVWELPWSELYEDSAPEGTVRMLRVMAGGAEVFVQVSDGVVVQAVAFLYEDWLGPEETRETLLHYFPILMRALIRASEPNLPEAEVAATQARLCPDMGWLSRFSIHAETGFQPLATHFTFGYDGFVFSFGAHGMETCFETEPG